MKKVHIIGRQNHGKTTLIVELISLYREWGVEVGSVKHSRHFHELDQPGKDSYRQRQAGADPAAILSKDGIAVFLSPPPGRDPYQLLAPLFSGCHLVLVEGHADAPGVKVEVWRRDLDTPPMASKRDDVRALISDDPVRGFDPVWPRSDLVQIARNILAMVK